MALQEQASPLEKYRVTLTTEERTPLARLVSAGKGAARTLTPARLLLLADTAAADAGADAALVAALGTRLRTVERLRQRLVTAGLADALVPRPQPARPGPGKIKGDGAQRLVRLACSDPPRGRCHWPLELLADELVVLGLVPKVSRASVRPALKKPPASRGSSRPGASRRTPLPTTSGVGRT
jgi:hypothetical protein